MFPRPRTANQFRPGTSSQGLSQSQIYVVLEVLSQSRVYSLEFPKSPPFRMATIRTSSLCCSRCLQLCSSCSLLQMDREAWVYSQKRLFVFALDSPSWCYFDVLDFGHNTPLHHHRLFFL